MSYSIPRDVFLLLEEAFNHDREKAEVFAKAIEGSIQAMRIRQMNGSLIKKNA